MKTAAAWTAACFLGCLFDAPASGQVTKRVSVSSTGVESNSYSNWNYVSGDGRFVAFNSNATNLVSNDPNGTSDVFLRDRSNGTTHLLSVSTSGVSGNGFSALPVISADGRIVAFSSQATNLVPGDANGHSDVFARDLSTGLTEIVSVATDGVAGNGDSWCRPSASADGRYVVFASEASNLVPFDTNGRSDVFVRDRSSSTTERVSIDSNGTEGDGNSEWSFISGDGRYVAFDSVATNLVAGDTNGKKDVFVHDRVTGSTERVSVASDGTQAVSGVSVEPCVSFDGRYVAFWSDAPNLVPGDGGMFDVFVHDRTNGITEKISVTIGGNEGNAYSRSPSISADGRHVAFTSAASNLVTNTPTIGERVFLRDRSSGTTTLVSLNFAGAQRGGALPCISSDARYVSFYSTDNTLVPEDTNGFADVFIRDRAATGFTSLCDPGSQGVIACPCTNPPSGSHRGCDNSAATGGAALTAAGIAYVGMDSVVFTTNGQRETATSILLQGSAPLASGVVFGQGVRCIGVPIKRLFVKSAVGGSITAPDLGAGDPTISARSASMGNPIHGGESRWYLVYYRDPIVLGGCPGTSTFNATQTGQVAWWP